MIVKHNCPPCNQPRFPVRKRLHVSFLSQASCVSFTIGPFLYSPKERCQRARIDLSPESGPCPRGMSTKPLHRLARHCTGLSSGDNWLSIRDRDNSVRVSRTAVNHYLSVRRPRRAALIFISSGLCLYVSFIHGSVWSIQLFFPHFLSHCLLPHRPILAAYAAPFAFSTQPL